MAKRTWCGAVLLSWSIGALGAPPSWANRRGADVSAPESWELFSRAQGSGMTEGPRLLLCQVEVSHDRRWDCFADPDLEVVFRLGKLGASVDANVMGPDGSHSALVTMPAPQLPAKATVRLTVFDRDLTEKEYIGSAEASAAGPWPLRLEDRYFRAECRLAEPALLEPLVAPRLQQADLAVRGAMRELKVVLSARGLGYPAQRVELAQDAVREAARLVGWEDVRVNDRAAQVDALEVKWRELRAQAVLDGAAKLPAVETDVEVEDGVYTRVQGARCSARRGCEVTLVVSNRTTRALPLQATPARLGFLSGAELVGESVSRLAYARGQEQALPPGGERTVTLVCECVGLCDAVPPLLRLGGDGALLRLRR